jgi:hypothetical protein
MSCYKFFFFFFLIHSNQVLLKLIFLEKKYWKKLIYNLSILKKIELNFERYKYSKDMIDRKIILMS